MSLDREELDLLEEGRKALRRTYYYAHRTSGFSAALTQLRCLVSSGPPTEAGPGTGHLHEQPCGCLGCRPAAAQLASARHYWRCQMRETLTALHAAEIAGRPGAAPGRYR